MALLELRHVSRAHGGAAQPRLALEDVCLDLYAGELVAVWGQRRSGRSTLLRVASGIEAPDRGAVLFEGRELARAGGDPRIALCREPERPPATPSLHEALLRDLLAMGRRPAQAARLAAGALERAGAAEAAGLRPCDLDSAQRVRACIARALLCSPRLLLIDEPLLGVPASAQEALIELLGGLAAEGIAVLFSTDEAGAFHGAVQRTLALDRGRLRGQLSPPAAEVLPLRRPA